MSRRSSRLEDSGYYDLNGSPLISYREKINRIFKKRRTHHSSCNTPAISSQGNSKRPLLFLILFLFVTILTFGLLYRVVKMSSNILNPELSESLVSTVIKTDICNDLEREVNELKDKLLILKKQISSLLPAADRLPNFALESLGAKVIPQLTSKSYRGTVLTLYGIPLTKPAFHPSTVIQGHSPLPGRCWAFAGGKGHLLIGLSYSVTISHVTLVHISKSLSPNGKITSAPKEITVYGMKNLKHQGTPLGTFLYNYDGEPVQTFKTSDNEQGGFNYVKLQVESNWGNPHYSCLYNFRVHGKIAS